MLVSCLGPLNSGLYISQNLKYDSEGEVLTTDICFRPALHVGTELRPHMGHPPVPTTKGGDPCDLERGDKEYRASKNQRAPQHEPEAREVGELLVQTTYLAAKSGSWDFLKTRSIFLIWRGVKWKRF